MTYILMQLSVCCRRRCARLTYITSWAGNSTYETSLPHGVIIIQRGPFPDYRSINATCKTTINYSKGLSTSIKDTPPTPVSYPVCITCAALQRHGCQGVMSPPKGNPRKWVSPSGERTAHTADHINTQGFTWIRTCCSSSRRRTVISVIK